MIVEASGIRRRSAASRAAMHAAVAALTAGCATNDARFIYDGNNPLDRGSLSSHDSRGQLDNLTSAVREVIGDGRTAEAFKQSLSRHGAKCGDAGGLARCTYNKAGSYSIPSPIPFVGVYWTEFFDIEFEGRVKRAGRLLVTECATKFGGPHMGRDEAKARQEEAEKKCRTFSLGG